MATFTDLTGRKFGKLIVLSRGQSKISNGKPKTMWVCMCDCGNETLTEGRKMVLGTTSSCGCLRSHNVSARKTIHGLSGKNSSPEYNCWRSIRERCNNPNNSAYQYYGGRGIKVDDSWNDFSIFLKHMGNKPSKDHSIDRINVDGNYCKENCRWATKEMQARNKRIRSKSGVPGVSFKKQNNKWQVSICVNGKKKYMGLFENLDDAVTARKEAEIKYWKRSS